MADVRGCCNVMESQSFEQIKYWQNKNRTPQERPFTSPSKALDKRLCLNGKSQYSLMQAQNDAAPA
jgi:hypothetical protein